MYFLTSIVMMKRCKVMERPLISDRKMQKHYSTNHLSNCHWVRSMKAGRYTSGGGNQSFSLHLFAVFHKNLRLATTTLPAKQFWATRSKHVATSFNFIGTLPRSKSSIAKTSLNLLRRSLR